MAIHWVASEKRLIGPLVHLLDDFLPILKINAKSNYRFFTFMPVHGDAYCTRKNVWSINNSYHVYMV